MNKRICSFFSLEFNGNAISQFDPKHLYLGCRFTRNFNQMAPAAKAAGQYLEVVSINGYSAHPIREQMDQWR